MDEYILLVLDGDTTEVIQSVDTSIYTNYTMKGRKGEKVLYVKIKKSLYVYLRSELLFYQKIRGELEVYGFVC